MDNDAAYYRLAARVFADFSGTIAVPAVLAAFLGKWLDNRYATAPRYLLICLTTALVFTAIVIVRKASRYGREYAELTKKEKEQEMNES